MCTFKKVPNYFLDLPCIDEHREKVRPTHTSAFVNSLVFEAPAEETAFALYVESVRLLFSSCQSENSDACILKACTAVIRLDPNLKEKYLLSGSLTQSLKFLREAGVSVKFLAVNCVAANVGQGTGGLAKGDVSMTNMNQGYAFWIALRNLVEKYGPRFRMIGMDNDTERTALLTQCEAKIAEHLELFRQAQMAVPVLGGSGASASSSTATRENEDDEDGEDDGLIGAPR
jgi:hypothetical protein